MIDELPLVGVLGALATGTTVVRGAAELRAKESDRIAPSSAPCARWACAPRSARTASRCAATGACRGGTMGSAGDHRLAMVGAVAGLASLRRASGWRASRRSRSRTRASPATSPPWGRSPRDRGDRRPRRAPARARSRARSPGASARPTSTPARCTAPLTWLAARSAASRARTATASPRSPATSPVEIEPTDDGDRVCVAGDGRHRRHPRPRGRGPGVRGLGPPGGARADGRRPARADGERRLGLRRPRRRQHGLPGRRGEGLPDRDARRSAPAAGTPSWPPAASSWTRPGARGRAPPRRARQHPRGQPAAGGRRGGRGRLVRASTPARWPTIVAAWSTTCAGERAEADGRPRQRPADHPALVGLRPRRAGPRRSLG